MKLSQFKFKLPEEQIAQYPAHHRDESRLMVLHKKSGDIEHRQYFKDILDYFDDKDVFYLQRYQGVPGPPVRQQGKDGCPYRSVLVERTERGFASLGCVGRPGS